MRSEDWPTDLKPQVLANFKTPRVMRPSAAIRARAKRAQREGNDEAHLAMLRQLWCALGVERPVDVHHLQGGPARKERGLGMRSPDRWAVPLAHWRHMELHNLGSRNEYAYFMENGGLDPYALAVALWASRGNLVAMSRILVAHQLQGSKALLTR